MLRSQKNECIINHRLRQGVFTKPLFYFPKGRNMKRLLALTAVALTFALPIEAQQMKCFSIPSFTQSVGKNLGQYLKFQWQTDAGVVFQVYANEKTGIVTIAVLRGEEICPFQVGINLKEFIATGEPA